MRGFNNVVNYPGEKVEPYGPLPAVDQPETVGEFLVELGGKIGSQCGVPTTEQKTAGQEGYCLVSQKIKTRNMLYAIGAGAVGGLLVGFIIGKIL